MAPRDHQRWICFILVLFTCTNYADASDPKEAKIMVRSPKDVQLRQANKGAPVAIIPVLQCGDNECDMTEEWCDSTAGLTVCRSCEKWCRTSPGICENNCPVFRMLQSRKTTATHDEDQFALNVTAKESVLSDDKSYTLESCSEGVDWKIIAIILMLVAVILLLVVYQSVVSIPAARGIYYSGENLGKGGQLKSKLFPRWMQWCIPSSSQLVQVTDQYTEVSTSTDDLEAGNQQLDSETQTQGPIHQPVDESRAVPNGRNVRFHVAEEGSHQSDNRAGSGLFTQQQPSGSEDERELSPLQASGSADHSDATLPKEVDGGDTTRKHSDVESVEGIDGDASSSLTGPGSSQSTRTENLSVESTHSSAGACNLDYSRSGTGYGITSFSGMGSSRLNSEPNSSTRPLLHNVHYDS